MRSLVISWIVLVCCAVAAPGPHARTPREADGQARRVVRVFDFEERGQGPIESMPRHWFRVHGPGLPGYTRVGLDDALAHSPGHSLKLQLNGGSAAAVLESGVVNVIPHARYLVSAEVRTARTKHSRARLAGVFLDRRGRLLPDTRVASSPITSEGRWRRAELRMPDAPMEAAWLVLRVELLQADRLAGPAGGEPHELRAEDLDAAAWFDDVTVQQAPRIALSTQTPTNVIRSPERPRLRASAHDLSGRGLRASIRVFDHRNRQVARRDLPLGSRRTEAWSWTPPLPGPGWYRARLRVRNETGELGRVDTAVAWLAESRRDHREEAGRLMILADDLPAGQRPLLGEMLSRIGPHIVLLDPLGEPGAGRTPSAEEGKPQERGAGYDGDGGADSWIEPLLEERPVAMALPGPPPPGGPRGAGKRSPPTEAASGADSPEGGGLSSWKELVRGLLARYGHRVRSWRIDPREGDAPPRPGDGLGPESGLRDLFAKYVAAPRVSAPWSALRSLPEASGPEAERMLEVPTSIRPEGIGGYAASWPEGVFAGSTLALDVLPAGRYGHEDRATDLALRMIHAWRAGPERIALARPWVWLDEREGTLLPDPLLCIWSQVGEQLAGRRFAGVLNLGPGIAAYLLAPADSGAAGDAPVSSDASPPSQTLVVWNRGAPEAASGRVEMDLRLGEGLVALDVWGGRHPLESIGEKQRLVVTRSPRFIEGVDARLARFRSGFRIEPGFVRSTQALHRRELTLKNPWPRTITGRVRLTGPGRWDFHPAITDFSIPAGKSYTAPIDVHFPISEAAGRKAVTARVEFTADRRYEINLAAPIHVGIKDVELRSVLSVKPGEGADPVPPRSAPPGDVWITLIATNLGERPRSFYAFALPAGLPRRQRIISRLEPGETVVKQFRLRGAAGELSGTRMRVGLRELNGPAVLNHVLEVP